MKNILTLFENKNITIYNLPLEESRILHYFYHANKVFIFYELQTGEKINLVNEFLAYFSSNDVQKKIIKELKFNNEDLKSTVFNIQSFLWDLYFIVINIIKNEEDRISDEDVNQIERNKFVARKIIIQSNNYEDAIKEINDIIFENKTIVEILNRNKDIFSSEDNIILRKILTDDISKHIKEELNNNQELSLQNITEYLELIQSKYLPL